MSRLPVHLMWLAAVAAVFGGPAAGTDGADRDVALKPKEAWGNVFGGRKAEFHFAVEARRAFRGRATWSLVLDHRAAARGEAAVDARPDKPAELAVRIDVPEVREGVALPAVFSLAVESAQQGRAPLASLERRLWIFAEDPFAGRKQWLEKLDIRLFDPGQKTRQVLEKMKVPFREARSVDVLAALEKGLVVVGEGTSLEEHGGLARVLVKAAERGAGVLWLAPSRGRLVLPGSEGAAGIRPSLVALRGSDVISELDKRLDALAWPPDGKTIGRTFALASDHARVVAEVAEATDSGNGWPWLEVRYRESGGALVVCGFSITEHWESGPTPRFLLARIFDSVAISKSPLTQRSEP